MILILGSTNDDLVYLKNKLVGLSTEYILGNHEVYIGKLLNREVVLSTLGFGQSMAMLVTSMIIERYHPYIIFNIGTVASIHPRLKQGDLFIATRIYSYDVDFSAIGKYKFGQVPNYPQFFNSDSDLIMKVLSINGEHKNRRIVEGILLSGNTFVIDQKRLNYVMKNNYIKLEGVAAIDTEAYGMAMAAHCYSLPFLCFRVCSFEVGNKEQMLTRIRKGILNAPGIGQILSILIKTNLAS